jgi:uncharacterized protein YeaO (DUF488 family)
MTLQVKRVYDPPTADGLRVLVDRLWPRGLSKQAAAVDEWLRDIAPSDALRKWYGHDPQKWAEFKRRYFKELAAHAQIADRLRTLARRRRVTLLYAAHDELHNNAAALRDYLARPLRTGRKRRHAE